MGYYSSIPEYQKHLKQMTQDLKKMVGTTLKQMGEFAQEKIRAKHGVQQPGWPDIKTNPTPLRKDGKLAGDVKNRVHLSGGYVEVGHLDKGTLLWKIAIINENGRTFKPSDKQRKWLFANVFKNLPKVKGDKDGDGMIHIPPRPIFRVVGKDEEIREGVLRILEAGLKKVFSA